jgi:hypothetical protein
MMSLNNPDQKAADHRHGAAVGAVAAAAVTKAADVPKVSEEPGFPKYTDDANWSAHHTAEYLAARLAPKYPDVTFRRQLANTIKSLGVTLDLASDQLLLASTLCAAADTLTVYAAGDTVAFSSAKQKVLVHTLLAEINLAKSEQMKVQTRRLQDKRRTEADALHAYQTKFTRELKLGYADMADKQAQEVRGPKDIRVVTFDEYVEGYFHRNREAILCGQNNTCFVTDLV